ncbi:MAG TPA: hypothetical protein PKK10_03960 [Woeseiaceae bacterium]|nr:hypothetical protein [Woeseiaceae bacterium]
MYSINPIAKDVLRVLVPSSLAAFVLAVGFFFFEDAYFTFVVEAQLNPSLGLSIYWGILTFTVGVFLGFFTDGRFYKTLFLVVASAWFVYVFLEFDDGRRTVHHLFGFYISGAPAIVPSLICGHVGFFVGASIRIESNQSNMGRAFFRSLAVLLVVYFFIVAVLPNAYFYWWEREARSKFLTALTLVGSTEVQGNVSLSTTDVFGEGEETTRIAKRIADNSEEIGRLEFKDYGYRWHTYEVAILLGESEEYWGSVSYYSDFKVWSVFCCEEPKFGTNFPDLFPPTDGRD